MLAGNSPLRGKNDSLLGDRFPSVSDAYDPTLQSIVVNIGESIGLSNIIKPDGVYCMAAGPSYESKAECRFLRSIGGDTVGMSTIPEIIAAKHCGMKILCLSFVTNKVITGTELHDVVPASHAEVMDSVDKGGKRIEELVRTFVSKSRIGEYLHSTKSPPTFDYEAHLKLNSINSKINNEKSCCSLNNSSKCLSKCNESNLDSNFTMTVLCAIGWTTVGILAGIMIANKRK